MGEKKNKDRRENLVEMIKPYQIKIEENIRERFRKEKKSCIKEACEYVLLGGGKRFRPALVLMMSEALGNGIDVSHAALTVEFFHTASLVADDLPCMDDDDERRAKPTVHKKYGEAIALLVSYALISMGYEGIAKNVETLKKEKPEMAKKSDHIGVLALENAAYNTGLNGATGGQFLDLFPSKQSTTTLKKMIQKKTGSLFEIAFILGWLFGGGAIEKIKSVKKAANHFGLAFQLVDDLEDMKQDGKNNRNANISSYKGVEKIKKMFHVEIDRYKKTLKDLHLSKEEGFLLLAKFLKEQVDSL